MTLCMLLSVVVLCRWSLLFEFLGQHLQDRKLACIFTRHDLTFFARSEIHKQAFPYFFVQYPEDQPLEREHGNKFPVILFLS